MRATDGAGQPAVINALAVDLEDYYQASALDPLVGFDRWPSMECRLRDSTERLLNLFAETDVQATFFVLGWNAERHPALIRRIAEAGHEVASHSYAHRLIYEMTPEEFRADLKRAQAAIEDATGGQVVGYRAPSYSITARSLWALDVLVEEGYVYDSSIFPIRHDRYGIPGAERRVHKLTTAGGTIWEVPPTTVRMWGMNLPAAAGGYLRLLPFWWTRRAVRSINHGEAAAALVSTHPWELDPAQPKLGLDPLTRIRHYRNLNRTEGRLGQLLREFRFATVSSVLALRGHHPATVPDITDRADQALVAG